MSKFGWFIVGIGVGMLGGILYAPRAGEETRGEVLSQANEAREKAHALAKQTVDSATKYAQRGKEKVGLYVDQGKTLANDHLAMASAALSVAKDAYTQASSEERTSEAPSDPASSAPATSA